MPQDLETDFGARLVTLSNGERGLRGSVPCLVKTAPGEHELDFIATDETLDRHDEVVKLDGWDLKNYRANPVVVDSHNYASVMTILGGSTELTIKDGKLVNRVKFAMDNPLGAISYKMAKAGFIRSESVGFIPKEWKNGVGPKEPGRIFLKQELLEISLVSVPANPGATIQNALKSGAVDRGDVRELYEFLKQFGDRSGDASVDSRAKADALELAQLETIARELSSVLRHA